MPACTTLLECPVWCWATSRSFSSTATVVRGLRSSSSRAVARPRIPAPTTATSHLPGGGSAIVGEASRCSTLGRRRTGADSGETARGMYVRVRDLEIALVLAREMKAAAARSVDASLRLDQLQEVFGVEPLDGAERARIQTALQMAGLEPFPSLLEADPAEPIRFGAVKTPAATAATTAGGGATAAADPLPEAPEPPEKPPPTFPTVGQSARSKFGRSRRARRGDHADGSP